MIGAGPLLARNGRPWTASDYAGGAQWVQILSVAERSELEHALEIMLRSGRALLETEVDDFPLPTLGPKLAAWTRRAFYETGLVLVRGLPVASLSEAETRALAWGLCL